MFGWLSWAAASASFLQELLAVHDLRLPPGPHGLEGHQAPELTVSRLEDDAKATPADFADELEAAYHRSGYEDASPGPLEVVRRRCREPLHHRRDAARCTRGPGLAGCKVAWLRTGTAFPLSVTLGATPSSSPSENVTVRHPMVTSEWGDRCTADCASTGEPSRSVPFVDPRSV